MLCNTLVEVSCCVADITHITKVTLEQLYHALFIDDGIRNCNFENEVVEFFNVSCFQQISNHYTAVFDFWPDQETVIQRKENDIGPISYLLLKIQLYNRMQLVR